MELIVVGVIVALIVIWGIATYNGLVGQRLRVQEGWSAIDVQLQRRGSLIPNLVETVKGYAGHERQTLEAVTEARARLQNASGPADAAQANNQITQTLRTLFSVAEAYPDLKANQNFQDLQAQLADTEDKISYARNYYNAGVRQYNTTIQSVPSVFVARMGGFQEAEFFEASEGGREEVKVNFGTA